MDCKKPCCRIFAAKTVRFLAKLCRGMCLCLPVFIILGSRAQAATIFTSPYVSFAPDNAAWTTCSGVTTTAWYTQGSVVSTGSTCTLRELEAWEHYYTYARSGSVPVAFWRVTFAAASCIHDAYKGGAYHGLLFSESPCGESYFSGWSAVCADCGGNINSMLIYMSDAAAASIGYLEVGTGLDYYYVCPFCQHLEQGVAMGSHSCKDISFNQYIVRYHANAGSDKVTGQMADSYHMVFNETVYEGETVIPQTTLTLNTYAREDYIFKGWNTKADGSGQPFLDGQEIYNLTLSDKSAADGSGIVHLYAVWKARKNKYTAGTYGLDALYNAIRTRLLDNI